MVMIKRNPEGVTRYALLAVCRPFGALFCCNDKRGLHPRLLSASPSDFWIVRMLYVMAGFRFATRYIYHSQGGEEHGEAC